MRRTPIVFAILLVCLPLWAFQQEEEIEIHETVDVRMVNITLAAVDQKGEFVTDLRSDELVVYEEEAPQTISFLNRYLHEGVVPLSVGFLLDNSYSMKEGKNGVRKLDIARLAVERILDSVSETDSVLLLFTNPYTKGTPLIIQDPPLLRLLTSTMRAKTGITLLLDRLSVLIDQLANRPGRKLLVVFSDGQDRGSHTRLNEIFMKSHEADINIVSIGTVEYARPLTMWPHLKREAEKGKDLLKDLAAKTGGVSFFPSGPDKIPEVLAGLEDLLGSQYALLYQSTAPATPGWHAVRVECKRPGVKLVYRQGYLISE